MLGWLFYLPMAVLGYPPLVFVAVGLIDLLYQYWIHTEQIGKLGWFDRVFASPGRHSSLELNETAYLLGYEDANSFFRAFQQWEGTSPGEWRSQLGAAG